MSHARLDLTTAKADSSVLDLLQHFGVADVNRENILDFLL